LRFTPGQERAGQDSEVIGGLDNPRLDELFPGEVETLREEVELVRGASAPFELELFLAGMQTPVFFGSGINNFGVQEVLGALVDWAPPPQPRDAGDRLVAPEEKPFSGFVFKIQANMDPKHRDRVAFLRVCSGRYTPGMKVQHQRLGREIRIGNAITFMANERVRSEDAVGGDILGIHNHGQLQIGDTLSDGEPLAFRGIPYFAPELFVAARPRDPFKAKQLQKGLQELGEEGAIQVITMDSGRLMLGAVGRLQFEIVAHRLQGEYGVDAVYDPVDIYTARWLAYPDAATQKKFVQQEGASLGRDVDGNPVFLARNRPHLELTIERWPNVGFHATREHGQILDQG
jgi:peptide chain release factor 3